MLTTQGISVLGGTNGVPSAIPVWVDMLQAGKALQSYQGAPMSVERLSIMSVVSDDSALDIKQEMKSTDRCERKVATATFVPQLTVGRDRLRVRVGLSMRWSEGTEELKSGGKVMGNREPRDESKSVGKEMADQAVEQSIVFKIASICYSIFPWYCIACGQSIFDGG
ncbi:hypothetical protein JB92DRAFT_2829040 [Gautieria morchelliformis]|nr:hypothetical protein JB92DRAFT_2829040 [Gautieria morchelliformis]